MTTVLATAANAAYGYHTLNLVGSVTRNSSVFDRIEFFDVRVSPRQCGLLDAVPGVVVREVPAFVPRWAQRFTRDPWAWMQVETDRVSWIDAGASVLRTLAPALDQVVERGYFRVSQECGLRHIVPPGLRLKRWLVEPSTYPLKARAIARGLRA